MSSLTFLLCGLLRLLHGQALLVSGRQGGASDCGQGSCSNTGHHNLKETGQGGRGERWEEERRVKQETHHLHSILQLLEAAQEERKQRDKQT